MTSARRLLILLAFVLMAAGIVLMLALESAVFLVLTIAGFVLVILSVPGLSRDDEDGAGEPAGTPPPAPDQPTMVQAPADVKTAEADEQALTQTAVWTEPEGQARGVDAPFDPEPPHADAEALRADASSPPDAAEGDTEAVGAPGGGVREVHSGVTMTGPGAEDREGESEPEAVGAIHDQRTGAGAVFGPPLGDASWDENAVGGPGALIRGLGDRAAERPAGAIAVAGAGVVGLLIWLRRLRS